MEDYKPVSGKTYSLYGKRDSTEPFYKNISALTDELLSRFSFSEKQLLVYLQSVSRSKTMLRKSVTIRPDDSTLASLLQRGHEILSEHTCEIEQHLRSVPVYKHITDRRLLTSREQYYLYMIEFELVNRLHIEKFKKSKFRIALLPYCLRETQTECKASPDEIDYICRGCLKSCYLNRVS
ncbi:MAG: DUF116 domain-containing protein, partial [Bacteroidales bacterium]|nr:DUF116 domain-containing protein [Bacteroidales bacterium]